MSVKDMLAFVLGRFGLKLEVKSQSSVAEMALCRKVAVLFLTNITQKRRSSLLSTASFLPSLPPISLLDHASRDALQDTQDTNDSALDINRLLRQHPGNMRV